MGEGFALVTDPSGLRHEPHYLRHFNWCVKYITIFQKSRVYVKKGRFFRKILKKIYKYAIMIKALKGLTKKKRGALLDKGFKGEK